MFIADLEDEVKCELNKCTVLCFNCHADIHHDRKKFNKNLPSILHKVTCYKECPPKVDKNLISSMLNDGMRQIDISRKLHVAKSTVCGISRSLCRDRAAL